MRLFPNNLHYESLVLPKMISILVIVFVIQCVSSLNKESSCGCGKINRVRKEGFQRADFISLIQKSNINQCPLYSNNEIRIEDMVLIPAGTYQVGTDNVVIESDYEGPKRMVELKGFYLDKYEVSNREFSRFVAATNYKTEAENFGESFVFQMFLNSTFRETLKDYRAVAALWWYSVNGSNWMHPYGPDSDISGNCFLYKEYNSRQI